MKPVKTQVYSQVIIQFKDHVWNQGDDQVRYPVWRRVWDQVDEQVYFQVLNKVLDKVWDKVRTKS